MKKKESNTLETTKKFLTWIEDWDNWERTGESEPENLSETEFAEFAHLVKHPNRELRAWIKDYCEKFISNDRPEQDRPRRKELFFGHCFVCIDRPKERRIATSFWCLVDDYLFRNYKSFDY